MTASDQIARPPDAPPDGPEWKKIPGVKDYEWSHRGKVRSLPRTKNGRHYEGADPMKQRPDPDDYLIVNYTDDEGVRHHGASVARMVLMAHDPDGYRPGLQACHGPGGRQDNRWPENLRWDTAEANREEALAQRLLNSPPKIKPTRTCPTCGKEHRDRGRRCHECVVELGVIGAQKMAAGMSPEAAAEELDYHPLHLINLAVKYGGLRFVIEDEINAALRDASHTPSQRSWLRRVRIRREAFRQDSDTR